MAIVIDNSDVPFADPRFAGYSAGRTYQVPFSQFFGLMRPVYLVRYAVTSLARCVMPSRSMMNFALEKALMSQGEIGGGIRIFQQ
jgi:hypothetical protein